MPGVSIERSSWNVTGIDYEDKHWVLVGKEGVHWRAIVKTVP
jgi:hypothetical protein